MIGTGKNPALYERVRYEPYGTARHRWGGDVDGDGDSDVNDKAVITGLTGTKISDGGYHPDADRNRDGVIDSNDVSASPPGYQAGLGAGMLSAAGYADNLFGYGGYMFAPPSMMYSVRHRWYSPELGRWTRRDPMGYVDGGSLYEYVGGRALSDTDPSGLDPELIARNGEMNLLMRHGYSREQAIRATHPVPPSIQSAANAVMDDIAAQGPRIGGGLRLVGGTAEAAVGVAGGIATGWTGVGAVGFGLVALHGVDNAVAGGRSAWDNQSHQSLTESGIAGLAEMAGMSPGAAGLVGAIVDGVLGFGGTAVAGKAVSGISKCGQVLGNADEAANAARNAAMAGDEAAGVAKSGTVWDNIKATQPNYDGTNIPRSFELATDSGNVWVHGNATKHLAEYNMGVLGRTMDEAAAAMNAQAHLTSLQAAVQNAAQQGIRHREMMKVGTWELMFGTPRNTGQLPALFHAVGPK